MNYCPDCPCHDSCVVNHRCVHPYGRPAPQPTVTPLMQSIAEEANFDANELCIYCGVLVDSPCDSPPGDTCQKALEFASCKQCGFLNGCAKGCPAKTVVPRTYQFFNAWPQCTTKHSCNRFKGCMYGCSSVEGYAFTGPNDCCPWDDFKPSRDLG